MKNRRIFIIFLFLLFSCVFISASSYAQECTIGYGYATTVLPKADQENFMWGFQYGLKKAYTENPATQGACHSFENIKVVYKFSHDTQSPLDALLVANDLIKDNVIMMVGFPSSHEALLAAKVAQQHNMAFVSIGAVANGLAEYKDNIFTTSPKRETYTKELIKGLANRHKGKEILIVAKKDFIFSMDILNTLQKENKPEYGLTLTPVFIDENLALDKQSLKNINLKNVAGVYITLYPSISKLAFLELQDKLNGQTMFYVSSAWISNKIEFFDKIPLSTKKRVVGFGAGVPNLHSEALKPLHHAYEVVFNKKPEVAVFEGYEAGTYVAHVLKGSSAASRSAVLDSMMKMGCVSVETFGEMCRTPEGYSTKKLYFYYWSPEGYVPKSL
ncbi:MAG: ABC transporter substrate-binding protein [bacterium]|nr:ABC transporter substrate-binding protein [bacterium]MBU1917236.1 ABC transporter substrate-binding protein [bacterium]